MINYIDIINTTTWWQ